MIDEEDEILDLIEAFLKEGCQWPDATKKHMLDSMRKFRILYKYYKNSIKPSYKEMEPRLIELAYRQFPEFNVKNNLYLHRCVAEIARSVAMILAFDIHSELLRIENGHEPDAEKFENDAKQYASPWEPHLQTIDSYAEFKVLSEEQKQKLVEDYNRTEIAACNQANREKGEFIKVVHSVLYEYFGHRLDALDKKGWVRYGIVIGITYDIFYWEEMGTLRFYLRKGKIKEDPGISYDQYMLMLHNEEFGKTESSTGV